MQRKKLRLRGCSKISKLAWWWHFLSKLVDWLLSVIYSHFKFSCSACRRLHFIYRLVIMFLTVSLNTFLLQSKLTSDWNPRETWGCDEGENINVVVFWCVCILTFRKNVLLSSSVQPKLCRGGDVPDFEKCHPVEYSFFRPVLTLRWTVMNQK